MTASCMRRICQRAIWVRPRTESSTWRHGCPGWGALARSAPRPTAPTTRPAASTSATGAPHDHACNRLFWACLLAFATAAASTWCVAGEVALRGVCCLHSAGPPTRPAASTSYTGAPHDHACSRVFWACLLAFATAAASTWCVAGFVTSHGACCLHSAPPVGRANSGR